MNPRSLTIGNFTISDDSDCYVIAEVGNNHQGEMSKAIALFRAAKDSGCQAVKLQKRDNRSLYTRKAFDMPYENPNSFGATYGEHREFLEFGKKRNTWNCSSSRRNSGSIFSPRRLISRARTSSRSSTCRSTKSRPAI